MTREEWLVEARGALADVLGEQGVAIPRVMVSCGWPHSRGTAARNRTIGQCWHRKQIEQDADHIFISPVLGDPVEVLATLLHELIHACLGAEAGHKRPFASLARACGLEGKPTSTHAGPDLKPRLAEIARRIGPYPHEAIEVKHVLKKQTTRLRLWECGCPVKARVARDVFNATCNDCGEAFKRVEDDDE